METFQTDSIEKTVIYLNESQNITHANVSTYSHHSIKRTGSIKRPGLVFSKKSLLNVPYDPIFLSLNSASYCLY